MDPDLRKHIIALLELGIKHSERAGLTETRLSEVERNQNLSRSTMREAIKHLGAIGAVRIIGDSPERPYGIIQAFVTDAGKLYHNQLIQESRQSVEKSAPIEIRESLQAFKTDHPDPTKVGFIMMKFKETPAHDKILKTIKDTLTNCGLVGIRSDDHEYHDDLLHNVETYMHGCGFGIAVFDRIEEEEFSPNVSLEVGYMMALGKDICLLKDKNLQTLHADLLGKLYKPFDPQNTERTIPNQLLKWLSDKGLGTPPKGRPSSTEPQEPEVLICYVPEDLEYVNALEGKLLVEGHASTGGFLLSSLAEDDSSDHPQIYDISYYSSLAANSDVAVLLVSRNFLEHWTKQGLEALVSKNILYKDFFKSFIAIWLGVTVQDVQSYSPYLANRYLTDRERSISSDAGIDQVFNDIMRLARAHQT